MCSVKATAASRSGEMIYYEPLYAFNFKFCVEILLWILASELRIQLQFFVKMSNSVLHSLQLCLTLRDKNTSSPDAQILPGCVWGIQMGSRGKASVQKVRGFAPEADDIMTFVKKTPMLALFSFVFYRLSPGYCKDKLFGHGRKPAAGEKKFLPPTLTYVAFSALSSGTDDQISWHVFHFSRHERACMQTR